jgi:hypothetical protein
VHGRRDFLAEKALDPMRGRCLELALGIVQNELSRDGFDKIIGGDNRGGPSRFLFGAGVKGKYETIYASMPLFGLAAAATHVRAEGGLCAARDRMRGG